MRSARAPRAGAGLAAVAAFLSGCGLGIARPPDLSALYDRAAQSDELDRNPVIVIPGILGSKLVDRDNGQVVWGTFGGDFADPETPDGARLLALPMRRGARLEDLRDQVEPAGVLDRVHVRLFGLPLEQQAYLYILGTLGVGGYRDEELSRDAAVHYSHGHFTCFQFSYDWRRDVAESARKLGEFIRRKKAAVEREIVRRRGRLDHEVRFDVIAHSMGGLVLRYYLLYGEAPLPDDGSLPLVTWAGAAHLDQAILVATPNAGSAHALLDLVDGVRFSFLLPRYGPAVLGTMPAVYELLPRTRHRAVVEGPDPQAPGLDVFDAAVWGRHRWGLAGASDAALANLLPDVSDAADRRRIAADHLRKALARAKQFHDAIDVPARLPPGLSLHLFAGDAEETVATLGVDRASGRIAVLRKAPGDATVTRASAVMDERQAGHWMRALVSPIPWTSVTFVFGDHLALTRDPAFTDNVLYRLLEAPRPRRIAAEASVLPAS